MKKKLPNIILIAVFIAGLSLLLYPTASNYWNSLHQSKVISKYAEDVAKLDNEEYEKFLEEAHSYNRALLTKRNRFNLTAGDHREYEELLDISGTGIMGYIEIPSIKATLAIYHGLSDAVLQIAVGHIAGSSLPVGGESTHSVISAHRGLPSARLFTDLDRLVEGDIFMIRTLDELLTYEVDQIIIVEPHEIGALAIKEGEDYCTLVTCTPYGINTHRILVRGKRIENLFDIYGIRVTADAIQIDPLLVAPIVAIPMVIMLMVWVVWRSRRRSRSK